MFKHQAQLIQQQGIQSCDTIEQTLRNFDQPIVENTCIEESSFLDNIAYQRSAFTGYDQPDIQDLNQKRESSICCSDEPSDILKLPSTKKLDAFNLNNARIFTQMTIHNQTKDKQKHTVTAILSNHTNNNQFNQQNYIDNNLGQNSTNNLNSSNQLNDQINSNNNNTIINNMNSNMTHDSLYNHPASDNNNLLYSQKYSNSDSYSSKFKIINQNEEINELSQKDQSKKQIKRSNTNKESISIDRKDKNELFHLQYNKQQSEHALQSTSSLQQRQKMQISLNHPFENQLKQNKRDLQDKRVEQHPMEIIQNSQQQQSSTLNANHAILLKIKSRLQHFLHRFLSSRRQQMLTLQVRQLIQDNSDVYQEIHKDSRFNWFSKILDINHNIYHRIHSVSQFLPIFSPSSASVIIIQAITTLINCCFAIYANIVLVFQISDNSPGIQDFLLVVIKIIWLIQLLVYLNTGYYTSHGVCMIRWNIITRRFQSIWFIFSQCIPCLILWIFSEYYHNPGVLTDNRNTIQGLILSVVFSLPLGLKFLGELNSLHKLGFYFFKDYKFNFHYQITALIVQSALVIHLLSCAQYLLLRYELNHQNIDNNDLIWQMNIQQISTEWPMNYLQAFYWSISIASTVSTSFPSSNLEYLFSSFTIFLTFILLVYFVSELQAIFLEQRVKLKEFNSDCKTLNTYLQNKKVNFQTSIRANMSLKDHYKTIFHRVFDEQLSLSKLSHSVKEEVLVSTHSRVLQRCKFLNNLFSAASVHRIQAHMEEIILQNKEKLTESRTRYIPGEEQYLYVVEDGLVQIEENHADLAMPTGMNDSGDDLFSQTTSSSNENETEEVIPSEESSFSSYADNQPSNKQDYSIHHKPQLPCRHLPNLRSITAGGIFGVYELFSGFGSVHGESKGVSRLLRISRKTMLNILKHNQRDYQVFMEITHRIAMQIEPPLSILGLNCQVCHQGKIKDLRINNQSDHSNHLQQHCYALHFDKQSPYIILRHNHTQIQHRQQFQRTNLRHHTTRSAYFIGDNQSPQTSTNNLLESLSQPKQDNFHQYLQPSIAGENQANIVLDTIIEQDDIMKELSNNLKDSFIPNLQNNTSQQRRDSYKPKESLKSILKNNESYHPKDSFQFKEALVSRDSQQFKDSFLLKDPFALSAGSMQLIGASGQPKDLFLSRDSGKQISMIPISKSGWNQAEDNTILSLNNRTKDDWIASDRSKKVEVNKQYKRYHEWRDELMGISSSNLIQEQEEALQINVEGSLESGNNLKLLNNKSPYGTPLNNRKSSLLKVRTNELLSFLDRPASMNAISPLSPKTPSRSQMQLAKEFASKQSIQLKDNNTNNINSKSYTTETESQESLSLPLLPGLFKIQQQNIKNIHTQQNNNSNNNSNSFNQEKEQHRENKWTPFSSLPKFDLLNDFRFYFHHGNHIQILQSFQAAQVKKILQYTAE